MMGQPSTEDDHHGPPCLQTVTPPSPEHDKPLKAGTVLNGRYHIERRLGQGGYGEVLAARDRETGLSVAIKILHSEAAQNDPRAAARMRQEAGILKGIEHPNIVRVLSIEDSPQGEFLVMERLHGETLKERLEKQGALSSSQALVLSRQLLGALALAHSRQVLHRDLKPDNILICYAPMSHTGEIAKLVDFGIAKAQAPVDEQSDEEEVTLVKTRVGSFVGTARYSAPEQFVGDPVGPQADLFCLGLVIAEMLTNKPRITSDNFSEAMAQVVIPRPFDVSDCPEDWRSWLSRMLEKSPSYRFETAREAIEALAEIFGPEPNFASTSETTAPLGLHKAPVSAMSLDDLALDQAATGQWRPLDFDYKTNLPRRSSSPSNQAAALEGADGSVDVRPASIKVGKKTSLPWIVAAAAVSIIFLVLAIVLVRYLVL
jgi:eukaryotic-like serine/threonine-protein kinase